MRYYCKTCGGVFVAGDKKPKQGIGIKCPQCNEKMTKIPDYETLAQYEERTGTPYSDGAMVWWKHKKEDNPKWKSELLWVLKIHWKVNDLHIVIVSPPVPPSDDFVPEEV